MKKLFLLLSFLLFANLSFSQSKIDSLIQEGIKFHDEGKYEKAIKLYNEALKLEPKEVQLNYEIALSSLYLKDYDNTIKYSDIVINCNDVEKETKRQAIITKGSALDYLGRTSESIELFEECLVKYGPNYLLYYNLGVDYYNIKEYTKAEDAFVNAINQKKDHPGSHYMLGFLMNDLNRKSLCMMSLYYFLYLEPTSERSKKAYKLLNSVHNKFIKKNDNNEGTTIFIDKEVSESSVLDFSYGMQKVIDLRNIDTTKTKDDIFTDNAKSFIYFTNTIKYDKLKSIWLELYVPFFSDLSKTNHMEVFCNYVGISSSKTSRKWLEDNKDKVREFDKWLKENKY
jgi:tetratricopeptide (TPR) repeat protein